MSPAGTCARTTCSHREVAVSCFRIFYCAHFRTHSVQNGADQLRREWGRRSRRHQRSQSQRPGAGIALLTEGRAPGCISFDALFRRCSDGVVIPEKDKQKKRLRAGEGGRARHGSGNTATSLLDRAGACAFSASRKFGSSARRYHLPSACNPLEVKHGDLEDARCKPQLFKQDVGSGGSLRASAFALAFAPERG